MKFRNYIPVKVKTHLYIDEAGFQRSDPNGEIINQSLVTTCDLPKCSAKQEGRGAKRQIRFIQRYWQSNTPEYKISQNHRNT